MTDYLSSDWPAAPPLSALVNKVHQMDALELLAMLPDKSIDAIISDPPYNMTELAFEQAIDWREFWLEARRVLKTKNCPTVLFSQQPFTTDLINSNRKGWRYEIIWEKSLAMGFLDANKRPLRAHENIQVFADGQANYWPQMETSNVKRATANRTRSDQTSHYGSHGGDVYVDDGTRYPRSVWKYAQRETAFSNTLTLHPTAKPLPLMKRLIATYTDVGALIVDPFAGSGSTPVAAQELGRGFIACDTDCHYVDASRKRLAQPYTPLFPALAG